MTLEPSLTLQQAVAEHFGVPVERVEFGPDRIYVRRGRGVTEVLPFAAFEVWPARLRQALGAEAELLLVEDVAQTQAGLDRVPYRLSVVQRGEELTVRLWLHLGGSEWQRAEPLEELLLGVLRLWCAANPRPSGAGAGDPTADLWLAQLRSGLDAHARFCVREFVRVEVRRAYRFELPPALARPVAAQGAAR